MSGRKRQADEFSKLFMQISSVRPGPAGTMVFFRDRHRFRCSFATDPIPRRLPAAAGGRQLGLAM
jgi:hypothetical protein